MPAAKGEMEWENFLLSLYNESSGCAGKSHDALRRMLSEEGLSDIGH